MDGWKLSRKAYHFGIAYRSVVSLSSSASFVELHHLPAPCFVPPDIYLQDVRDPPATSSSWNCLNPEWLLTTTHLFLSFSHLWNHFPYSQSQLFKYRMQMIMKLYEMKKDLSCFSRLSGKSYFLRHFHLTTERVVLTNLIFLRFFFCTKNNSDINLIKMMWSSSD